MGVRCSLLGHSFDGPRIEREHDERGDHPVTVVREVRTCRRCGEVTSSVSSIEPARPSSRGSKGRSPGSGDAAASEDPDGADTGATAAVRRGNEAIDRIEAARTRQRSVGGDSPAGAGSVAEERFLCGRCGFAVGAVESPYAAGDICPECYEGYLGREP